MAEPASYGSFSADGREYVVSDPRTLAGMPRRYVDYPEVFAGWNAVSSIGAYIQTVAVLTFLYGIYEAFSKKRVAGDNPWGEAASTLEWSLPSPPPFHQFNTLPKIK